MTANLSKGKKVLTLEEAKAEFLRHGLSVAGWAKENGFSPALVSSVLRGKCKGLRGDAHRIAVLLKIKDGIVGGAFGAKVNEAN